MRGSILGIGAASLLLLAETAAAGDFGFAIEAGLNRARAVTSGPGAFDTQAGNRAAFGVAASYAASDAVSVELELLFSELAFSTDDFGVEASVEARVVQLPLSFKPYLGARDGVRGFLRAGGQVLFIGRTLERFAGEEQEIDEDVVDVDLGLLLGAGLELPVPHGALRFELRHVWGLRDLDTADADSVKQRTLQLLAGYRF